MDASISCSVAECRHCITEARTLLIGTGLCGQCDMIGGCPAAGGGGGGAEG